MPGCRHAVSTASRISGPARLPVHGRAHGRCDGRALGVTVGTWKPNSSRASCRATPTISAPPARLPVRAAPSPSDVDPEGGLSTFARCARAPTRAKAPPQPAAAPAPTPSTPPAAGGIGARDRARLLGDRRSRRGELGWLEARARRAQRTPRFPATRHGQRRLVAGRQPAADEAAVEQVLLGQHGASAYLFDSPNENRVNADRLGLERDPRVRDRHAGIRAADRPHPKNSSARAASCSPASTPRNATPPRIARR